MDSVHRIVNRTGTCPQWTVDRGFGGGSTELGLTATPEHGSSPAGAQQREGDTGISTQASLWCGWQCRGRVTTVKKRRRRCSVWAALRLGKKGRRAGRGAVEGSGALPLYMGLGGGRG
jgi:hypothetical protein